MEATQMALNLTGYLCKYRKLPTSDVSLQFWRVTMWTQSLVCLPDGALLLHMKYLKSITWTSYINDPSLLFKGVS